MPKEYIPISCSFYDYLEEAATMKQEAIVKYYKQGKVVEVTSRIKTLEVKNKVEYMILINDDSIRLDKIISFNDKPLVNHC